MIALLKGTAGLGLPLIAITTILVTTTDCGASQKASKTAITEADDLCNRGRYREAVPILKAVFPPKDVSPMVEQNLYRAYTRALVGSGEVPAAMEVWKSVLKTNNLRPERRQEAEWEMAELSALISDYKGAKVYIQPALAEVGERRASGLIHSAQISALEGDSSLVGRQARQAVEVLRPLAGEKRAENLSDLRVVADYALAAALAGDRKTAETELGIFATVAREHPGMVAQWQARIYGTMRLRGETMRALQAIPEKERPFFDPCLESSITWLRSDAEFKRVFPQCEHERTETR